MHGPRATLVATSRATGSSKSRVRRICSRRRLISTILLTKRWRTSLPIGRRATNRLRPLLIFIRPVRIGRTSIFQRSAYHCSFSLASLSDRTGRSVISFQSISFLFFFGLRQNPLMPRDSLPCEAPPAMAIAKGHNSSGRAGAALPRSPKPSRSISIFAPGRATAMHS